MSGSRDQEKLATEKFFDDHRKKASDTLFLEAKMLFFKVKNIHDQTKVEKKHEGYIKKNYMTKLKLDSPINAKKLLSDALLFSKASADMGNENAKSLFKEAKTYQANQTALEDDYILVQPSTDVEAKVDANNKNPISIPSDDKREQPEEESEIIATKLHFKINFINDWYPDPDVCVESPVLKSSFLQIY